MIVSETFTVAADSVEEAIQLIRDSSTRDSVIIAAPTLDALMHPIHLAEAHEKFGYTPPVREEAPAEESVGE